GNVTTSAHASATSSRAPLIGRRGPGQKKSLMFMPHTGSLTQLRQFRLDPRLPPYDSPRFRRRCSACRTPLMDQARVSLLRWLRRQLRQPLPGREHLEAAVENDDPEEARRLL